VSMGLWMIYCFKECEVLRSSFGLKSKKKSSTSSTRPRQRIRSRFLKDYVTSMDDNEQEESGDSDMEYTEDQE
jgi:hypothetical protein